MKAETISSTGRTAVPFPFRHSFRAEVTSFGHNSYTYTPHLHIHVGGNAMGEGISGQSVRFSAGRIRKVHNAIILLQISYNSPALNNLLSDDIVRKLFQLFIDIHLSIFIFFNIYCNIYMSKGGVKNIGWGAEDFGFSFAQICDPPSGYREEY